MASFQSVPDPPALDQPPVSKNDASFTWFLRPVTLNFAIFNWKLALHIHVASGTSVPVLIFAVFFTFELRTNTVQVDRQADR